MATDSPVLIVGGGLTGLSAAHFLARRGVRCLVVERHPTTSIQYKFAGISPRTMEIYREAGIEQDIRARVTRDQKAGGIARMKNLADPSITWDRATAWPDTSDISPVSAATLDQDKLEPVLKAHAESFGADVRLNTELVDFEQDHSGVRARIRNRATAKDEVLTADYLLAADGANGTVRERLGIQRHGPGVLQRWMNIIFEADMPRTLEGRQLTSVFLGDINGTFVPRENGRWLMAVQYQPERGERPEDFTDERCLELVRKGAGRSDVKVEIVDARRWEVAAYVADQYRAGRAFIIGDAAHLMPPTGGFGGNTGIHDAHNLAWKLDMVLRGVAGPALLDTYEAERKPVAERTLAQALARLQAWFRDPSKKLPPAETVIEDENVVFGYVYGVGALVPEHGSSGGAFENPRRPSGRPGSRAPNLVIRHDGTPTTLYDLCQGDWVLLAGPTGQPWCVAANSIGIRSLWVDVDFADLGQRWSSAYGVMADGAVVIRPDNHVAWRASTLAEDPGAKLSVAFERVTCRRFRDEPIAPVRSPRSSDFSSR